MKFFTHMRLRASLLIWLSIGLATVATAQQRTVTGTVVDVETGEALIGVTVIEKETPSNGAVTDIEGNFKIRVSEKATALLLSYSGYENHEEPLAGQSALRIAIKPGAILKEVVVIGYGSVKREDATGLVQSVSTQSFNRGAITSPQELLSGKIAGVVITSDGSPGGGAKIRIRGESSLSASKDPLIVIDGVPIDNGGVSGSRNALNLLNPNDIETFTVLKDASAAAIYGNRASGGVIIITTKKGKLGKKVSVNYNVNASVGEIVRRVDVLNADEFRQAVRTKYTNPDPAAPAHPALGLLRDDVSTDWQNEIYQQAFAQDHNLSVSGGIANKLPYRVSLGYTNKDGLLKTDNFNRYSSAINLNPTFLNNRLQVNLHFKGIVSKNHFADRGAIGAALSFDPTKPVRDTSTAYGGYYTWKIANGNPNGLAPANPVALLELRDDNSTVRHYITNATLDYRFAMIPELRANLNLAYDRAKGEGNVVIPNFASFAFDAINGGGVNNLYEQTKENSLLETYLNYKKAFGQHDVDLMGGYSWQHFAVDNYFKNSDSAGTPAETSEGRDPAEYYLISLFTRLNYTFQDRYLFTASLRRDGTSRFAPEYRWGLFPAAALAVKVVENDKDLFNNMKVRLSWGITGQQDIGDYYAYLARYQIGQPTVQYQFGDDFITTIRPNGYVGDIKWEETTTYNGGLDFSIIRDRLSGTLDVYQRNTRDLLNFIPFAALSNLTNFATDNVGNMRTRGVELSLNLTPVKTKLISWDLSINGAYNRSEITKLTTNDDPNYRGVPTGGIAGGVGSNIQIHTVGYMPASFYVNQQLYSEDGTLLEGQFADLNGDSIVNAEDRYRYKNPAPLYTFGMTSNFAIGNFDFAFGARAHFGNYVYNNVQTDMGYLNRLYNSTRYLSNVNQSAVDLNVNDQAKLTFSDHFITDGSFVRFDHISAGYNFKNLIGKSTLRLYGTVQNPFVFTNYQGIDPEIGNGIDNNTYPRPRTYLMGLNVNF